MGDFVRDIRELLCAPQSVRLIMFSGLSLFVVVVLVVIHGVICSIKQDRYLKEHYFEQWKLRRGTWRERRSVVIPDDPFFAELADRSKKTHRWIMIIWFAVLTIASLIITLR